MAPRLVKTLGFTQGKRCGGDCKKTFAKITDFEDHKTIMKKSELAFEHCDKNFTYRKVLQGHIRYEPSGLEIKSLTKEKVCLARVEKN